MRGGMRNEVLDEIYEQYSTVCYLPFAIAAMRMEKTSLSGFVERIEFQLISRLIIIIVLSWIFGIERGKYCRAL